MMVGLHLGDCRDFLADLPRDAAIVSDPPYGIRHIRGLRKRSDYSRFSGGKRPGVIRYDHAEIASDDRPFDPSPWLAFPKVVLFGFNCYSDRIPPGSALVWCKKPASKLGKFLGDCELAWMKGGHGTYLFHHVWDGVCRDSEIGQHLHPSQKPVALMRWCIERLKLKPGTPIIDPYMGSGSTGVAAVQLGHPFIGIEIDPEYHAIARRRIDAEREKTSLLDLMESSHGQT